MLELHLFGAGKALVHGHALHGFPHQQPYLLLCYLALNRSHPHPREPLATVFWPEHGSEAALKCLRNVLWRLRRELEAAGAEPDAYLGGNEHNVTFHPIGPFWLDVEAFEVAVGAYLDRPGQYLLASEVQALEAAVAHYSGELMEGVYEDWCLSERERLRLLYLASMSKLMDFYEAHGRYEHALGLARRILAVDPVREQVHRVAMWLAWLSGDQSGALAQYRHCETVLQDELGVSPARETTELYERIRAMPVPLPSLPELLPTDLVRARLQQLATLVDETRRQIAEMQELLQTSLSFPPTPGSSY